MQPNPQERPLASALARRALGVIAAALLAIGVLIPAASAELVRVRLVVICDVYQMDAIDGRGGLARIAGAIDQARAGAEHVIVAHAGDTISPSLMSGIDQGAHMIDLLNMVGLDVFAPGNHEFDFGPEVFMERMREATFPVYAANLAGPGGAPIEFVRSHAIVEFGGVRVGLIGATDEDSVQRSSPGDLTFAETIPTIERLSEEMREDGADLIVAVAHADRDRDEALLESGAVDVLLSGHDHDLAIYYDGEAVLAESMQDGLYVVVVDLEIEVTGEGGSRKVSWWPEFQVIDTADVTPDPEVAERVAYYASQLSEQLDVAIGRIETELDSRNAEVRGGEAAIGNLFTDAIRAATGADAALLNGGAFRGNKIYPAGAEISRRDVLAELPFGNLTLVVELTGAQLRAALEQGLANAEDLTGAFPQISGMRLRADLTRPVGDRVVSLEVGGEPVDPDARYKVATNDFLARGGDAYTALTEGTLLVDPVEAELIANHVMNFIEARGTVAPAIEGRTVLARAAAPQ